MTDKIHFDDLTKITCPTGMLDDDTFERLYSHAIGGDVDYWGGDSWSEVQRGAKLLRNSICTYRLAPKPVCKTVYPWAALHRDVVACAVDTDSFAYAFDCVPTKGSGHWWRESPNLWRIDSLLVGYSRGDEPWAETLQLRPEGE